MKRRNIFHKGKVSLIGRYYKKISNDANAKCIRQFLPMDTKEDQEIADALDIYIANWKPEILDISMKQLKEDDRQ